MDRVTSCHQCNRGFVIPLEGGTITVEGVAVGLDDHLRIGPVEVDEVAIYKHVYLGSGQICALTESQEIHLKGRNGIGGARVYSGSYSSKAAESLPPVALRDDPLKFTPVQTPRALGRHQHLLQLAIAEPARLIHNRSLDGRDRKPASVVTSSAGNDRV